MLKPDIEAYLNGHLRGGDLDRFEAELARDPDLREEVEALRPLARDLTRMGLERRIELAGKRRFERKRLRKNGFLLGGALFAVVGLGWFFFGKDAVEKQPPAKMAAPVTDSLPVAIGPVEPQGQPANPALPDNNNAPPRNRRPIAKNPALAPTADDRRRQAIALNQYQLPAEYANLRTETDDGPLRPAKTAFAEGRYDDAIRLLDGNGLADLPEAKYLRGHALFAKTDHFGAWLAFSSLMEDPNWRGPAEWYGLLSGLASGGQVSKATLDSLLQNMAADPGHPFRAAQALKLKDLLDGR